MRFTPGYFAQLARRSLLIVLLAFTPVTQAIAEQQAVTEYHVKAAFLYNFSRFVNWPETPVQAFRLCILGDNPFDEVLDTLIGKTVHESILVVEELTSLNNVHECQIVYLGRSMERQLQPALAEIARYPVLTVSDIDDFTERGGMIGLTLAGNRVRFEINSQAAGDAGLTISSKLLSLATNVKTGGRQQ